MRQHAAPAAPQAAPIPAFRIGAVDDAAKHQADAVATRVPGGTLRRSCAACEAEEKRPTLRRRAASGPASASDGGQAVARALSGPGSALPSSDAAFFGPRMGADLSGVRLHHGPAADAAARSVGARAFALGRDIVFAQGEYAPGSQAGRHLLAHELAHVAQDGPGVLRRFTRAEEGDISTIDEVIDQARTHASSSGSAGLMRWGRFTAANGGSAAGEVIAGAGGSNSGSTASTNSYRYLFTCLCGLVDMRHFFQLMYASMLEGNADAVQRGRDHELNAEPTSRFAAEDSPSNALGAYFGSEQSMLQRQSVFVSNLRAFLTRCHPTDYDALPEAQRNSILDWYAVDGTNPPAHQNETAIPNMARIPACGGLGVFPYVLDGAAVHRNRLSGMVDS